MEIYKSEYLIIEHEITNSLLIVTWKEKTAKMTNDVFLREVTRIVEFMLDKKIKLILADDRNFLFIVTVDIQEIVARDINSRIKGIEKFAHVRSTDFIANLSVEQTFAESKNKPFKEMYFDSKENALKWLLDE